MSKIRLFTLTFVWCFLSIFSIYGDNISRTPDSILFQQKEKQSRKRMPPRYMSYLTYYNGEACFHSTQPYAYATIVVTDDTDSVIGSMIVSPEDNCGLLDLQSGCTITCTFDNGTVISTTY